MTWLREIAGMFRSDWGNEPAGKIFINYRRSDSPGIAGRLSDSLTEYFGDERGFRDIEDIEQGARFGSAIDSIVESTDSRWCICGRWRSGYSHDMRVVRLAFHTAATTTATATLRITEMTSY